MSGGDAVWRPRIDGRPDTEPRTLDAAMRYARSAVRLRSDRTVVDIVNVTTGDLVTPDGTDAGHAGYATPLGTYGYRPAGHPDTILRRAVRRGTPIVGQSADDTDTSRED